MRITDIEKEIKAIKKLWKKHKIILLSIVFLVIIYYIYLLIPCKCPANNGSEENIIRSLIQEEATATINKDLLAINCIYSKKAIIKDEYYNIIWDNPKSRYDTLYKNNNFHEVRNTIEQFNLTGIFGRKADVLGKSFVKFEKNGQIITYDNPPKSCHWVLKKNIYGCWKISEFSYNIFNK